MNTLIYAFKNEWYNIILLLVPFAIIPYVWDMLPEQIPTHWNIQGEPDDYSSKSMGLFFVPILNIGIYLLLLYIPFIDPKKRVKTDQKPIPVVRFITVLLLLGIWIWAILQALGTEFDIKVVLYLGLNLFFLIMGNYLKTIQPNYFIGIRIPWTLEDAENWKKTHNLASYIWVAGAILLFMLFPFFAIDLYTYIFLSMIVIMTLIPVGYSFYIFKAQS